MRTPIPELSEKTKELISSPENDGVDFKRKADAIKSEDLVSFANSSIGGTILVGVDETIDENGNQVGKIVGCDVGDGTVLQIMNKAIDCVPAVKIKIYTENSSKDPILRVEIPTGDNKPYSTKKGIYCVRENNRNRGILPDEMLDLFLEREKEEFSKRFADVAADLETTILGVETQLEASVDNIVATLGFAESSIDTAESYILQTLSKVREISGEQAVISERVKAIVEVSKVLDPTKERAKTTLARDMRQYYLSQPELVENIKKETGYTVEWKNRLGRELSQSDCEEVINKVVGEIIEEQKKESN